MIYGHRHQGGYEIPDWAAKLKEYYWMIRVQGRDKSKQRRYYRLVSKEKLRLAENGFDQDLIRAVCRYLAGFSPKAGARLRQIAAHQPMQMTLHFK